ncbi:MAG: polymer-forming cytoskeletal protein [Acidobacteriota bacterium]
MKRRSEPTGDLSGFLDHGTEFKGDITFTDTLRIDGTFEGSVRGRTLVVGETADVNADIEVGSVFVSGRLRGRVQASERVELQRTARVQLELDTSVLVIEEGAVFEGSCSMQKAHSGPRELESRSADLKKIVSST